MSINKRSYHLIRGGAAHVEVRTATPRLLLGTAVAALVALAAPFTINTSGEVTAHKACAEGTCCDSFDATCYPGEPYPPQDNAYYVDSGPCGDDRRLK